MIYLLSVKPTRFLELWGQCDDDAAWYEVE